MSHLHKNCAYCPPGNSAAAKAYCPPGNSRSQKPVWSGERHRAKKSPYGAASDIGRKKARMEHQRHRAKKRPYGAASDIGRPKRNCTNARLLSILFAYWRLSCTLIYAKDVPFVVSFHGDARRACIDGADGKRGGSKEVVKCLKRCSSKSG